MSESLINSFLVSDVSESLSLLTKNERFAQVAQRKWAIVSESLRLLTKNELFPKSTASSLTVIYLEGNGMKHPVVL